MRRLALSVVFAALIAASLVHGQEPPKLPAPQKEHEWLKQFVGEWESEGKGTLGAGQPALECKGTMNSRELGGFWVVSEMKSEMMGVPMSAIQTLGYDARKKKYVGTWVDSMMNHMWQYNGTVDDTGKILTLEAEGPDFMVENKTRKYRDIYEFKSKDHIVLSSAMQGDDGKWVTFMSSNIRRKKP